MQETNINFTGLALTPYSDISPDGQLSVCAGLEFHGGALRPSMLGGAKYTLPDDGRSYRMVHIHTTSAYSHFILSAGDELYWADVKEGDLSVSPVGTFGGFSSANSVGNTLVVLTSGGIHYSLWKEGSYHYIGQKPPEIGISFGLSTTMYDRSSDAGSIDIVPELPYSIDVNRQIILADKDDQREYVTNVVWEAINKVIDGCSKNNRFCMPFFVRAAYRMFGEVETYTMLTPPVLMIPDSTGPKAFFTFEKVESEKLTGKIHGRAWASILLSSVSSAFADGAKDWSDIISSVDIFVSPQVMRADSSDMVSVLYGPEEDELTWHKPPSSYGIGAFVLSGLDFKKTDFDWQLSSTTMKYFEIPMKDDESFLQDLNGNVQFYKVRSIPLGQLSGLAGAGFLPVLEKSLDFGNIVQQDSLPDRSDYQSHDSLISLRSHVYNQRLHLFDLERSWFSGFLPEFSWAYTNSGPGGEITVSVYVSGDDGITRVVQVKSTDFNPSELGRFLYYPNINANRMVIKGGGFNYDIPLQPHPLLNGAYYIFMDKDPSRVSVADPELSNKPLSMANKIYLSEVGNPFSFPLEGIYTIGTGKIYGLSSVATALSQGQFGQFPLMAFCSDGNYAMSVNEEGRYSAIHPPVQRDVCINPDAITQTDSEVLFISSRGVMVTSGAAANCISSELDGVPEVLPEDNDVWIYPEGKPSDFFRTCRVAYDYTNRRIIFFPEQGTGDAWYVYSIDNAFWSSASFGPVESVINVFPYSYVQVDGRSILALSDNYSYEGEIQEGILFTRPIKLGSFQLKKILRLSLQGVFSEEQNISIYVSNDCRKWIYVGTSCSSTIASLRGRPFKYCRFVIKTKLLPSENISLLRVHFETRKERRFR
jgi:hypothetical protein